MQVSGGWIRNAHDSADGYGEMLGVATVGGRRRTTAAQTKREGEEERCTLRQALRAVSLWRSPWKLSKPQRWTAR